MKKNIFKLGLVAILAVVPFIGQQVGAQVPAACGDVMLQAFDYYPQPINIGGTTMTWNDSKWNTLNTQVLEIGESFQMIWLPPSGKGEGYPTTMGYHPQYYFNQTSTFGSQSELITLIANLKTNNCKAIADIVINHRSSPTNWCTFATETYKGVTYTPNSSWICTNDESRSTAPAGCNNPTGANDSGELYDAARDLDHTNSAVRDNIKAYMQFLKNDIGYSGWRYDVAKGYGQSYLGEYNDAAAGYFSVGEVMETSYDYCKNWINNTSKRSTAFDFPCQAGIREALNNGGSPDYTKLVSSGQPRGLIAADMKRYAVTFVENHDTYRYNLGFYGNIEVANAFIISSPGVPCVYLPHWNKYKTNIKKMIAARKKAGLHSESSVTMLQSAANIYVAKATGTKGDLIVKLGSGSYSAPAGFTLEGSGTDWAIWTNVTTNAPSLVVTNAGGTYIGGTTVTLSSTGGTPAVKIYYTLDGVTTPTANSTLYTAPISITANNTTLKAIAIDAASLSSAVATHTYITAVAAVLNVDKVGGTYIGGTTVTLTSTGGVAPVKIYYTVNNTIPTAASTLYTAPISITTNNTVLQAVAIDNSGVASPVAKHTYVTNPASGITMKFKAPAAWTTVACYAWKGANTVLAGAWPGTVVTKDVNGYYSFFVSDISTLPINAVFNNNNGGQQTIDLSTSTDICWNFGTQSGSPAKYSVTVAVCPIIASLADELAAEKTFIYPNPASESFTIESELNLKLVQIYSINGIMVKSVQVESNIEQISISDLASGFYSVVAINTNGGRSVTKLIKK